MFSIIKRPGYTKTLTGEGMPYAEDNSKRGDLVIEFDIEYPKTLTPESKALIKQALQPKKNKKTSNYQSVSFEGLFFKE